jgi:LmbE family N-acetylglucosaminyl deacetylase
VKILSIHAHPDDFEFAASGLFELWRRKLGNELQARVLVCTDGKAGHHFRTREETLRVRMEEQEASARAGQFEARFLRYPNGEIPREACLQVSIPLLAALWKEIRDFQPNYIFAPAYPSDPLAGVHVDHVAVSEAVRKVAYMINVPHAFTPEYPADETRSAAVRVPVILTVYDAYMSGENAFDLAIDVEDAFEVMCAESWRHQSQIVEWLPWVGRHSMAAPASIEEWAQTLRARFARRNREMGLPVERIHEFFSITAWGDVPSLERIIRDFPGINTARSRLPQLEQRLRRWANVE